MDYIDIFKQSIALFWRILTSEPTLLIWIAIAIGGSILYTIITTTIKQYLLRKSGILEVDKMSGRRFEEFLQALLRSKGYQVQLTPASGDYGADLILTINGRKIIAQAKRYSKNVGIRAVQEIASAQKHYKAEECWVITNSFFTEQARKLAQSNEVKLVDRKQLMNWMRKEHKSAG